MAYETFLSNSPQFSLTKAPGELDATEFMFMKLMMEMVKAFSSLLAEAGGNKTGPSDQ